MHRGRVERCAQALPNAEHRKIAKVVFCVVSIVGSLVVYGLLQERIMTQPYGSSSSSSGETFQHSVFLVLCNRTVSMTVAAIMLAARSLPLTPGAPVMNFAAVSVSNVLATTCQYEALKYVTFPVQTLGKCAKMVPVMIWGRLISGKRYNVDDYAVALAVMLGCTAFLLSGETKSRVSAGRDDALTSIFGLALMAGYLGFDGFTSTFQDKLFKGYHMETYNQMLWVNMWSALISLVSSAADSSLFEAIAFVQRHPESLKDMLVLSLAATIGQLVILYTIKEFGALLFATVMTTRQFLSILLSSIVYLHPLSLTQWAGTVTVFSALYYQSFMKKSKGSSSSQQTSSDSGGKAASHESDEASGTPDEPKVAADEEQHSNGTATELPTSTTDGGVRSA